MIMRNHSFQLSRELSVENRQIFDAIACHLSASSLSHKLLADVYEDIVGMFWTWQNEGASVREKIGGDETKYAEDILSAIHPRKTLWKWLAEALGLASMLFCLLVTLRVVFLTFPQMWGGHPASTFLYTLRDLWQLVLLFGVTYFVLLHIGKSALRLYARGIKKRDRFLILGLLYFSVLVNPFISAPLEKVHIFTAGLIPVTAGLLVFWLLVLVFALCYQIEYKRVFHKYFTGRDLFRKK